ncbi:MAG: HEPN domain-containing protein [Selenomonadaceae bacterium]|nr:HEPN domain-containing protein [Selenomonadaceae bacterium]
MMQRPNDDVGDFEDLVIERFRMAEQFIHDAKLSQMNGSYNTAADRAYYSIFKSLSALHTIDGYSFRSHKSLLGSFNKNYIHTGLFPKEYGGRVYDVQNLRHISDYGDFQFPTNAEVEDAIMCATEVMYIAKKYCQSKMTKIIDNEI